MPRVSLPLLSALVLTLVLTTQSAAAETPVSASNLFDLSLEELMAIPVSIATRHDTALKHSPSTVHQFSRDELDSLSVKNVYELLNYVPGFHVTRTINFADTSNFHIRGFDASDRGYLLVMLNGVPLNEISQGNSQVYMPFIPISLVEKVEIIAGPGAAIYGNNAYLGVLNVITRTTGTEVHAAIGNQDSFEIAGLFSSYLDDDKLWHLSGGYYDYRDEGFDYLFNDNQTTQDPRQHRNLFSTLQYKNWRVDFGWSEAKRKDFIQFASIANGINQFEVNTLYLKLGHEWQPSADWQVNSSFYYKRSNIDQLARFGQVTASDGMTRDRLLGPYGRSEAFNLSVDAAYDLTSAQRFSVGASILHQGLRFAGINQNHDSSGTLPVFLGGVRQDKHNEDFAEQEGFFNTYGLYAQYEYIFNDQWRTTVGVRHDYYELTKEHTTNPRVAVIYTPSESTTLKAIYGSAYRAPAQSEKLISAADPDLRSETIQTAELSVNHNFGKANGQLTYFYSALQDLIEERTLPNGRTGGIANTGDRYVSGIEASATVEVTDQLRVTVNHTHILQTIEETRFEDFSSFMALYRQGRWSASFHGTYRSDIETPEFEEGDVFLGHAKIGYELFSHTHLFVVGQNIFDASYDDYVPALSSGFGSSLPGRGRLYLLGVTFTPN